MNAQQTQDYLRTTLINGNFNVNIQQVDDDISALSNLLAASVTGSDLQRHQPAVDIDINEQAMAALLATAAAAATTAPASDAYTDNQALQISAQTSPLILASLGLTPTSSIQNSQYSNPNQTTALAAAVAATSGIAIRDNSPLLTCAVDMESQVGSQTLPGLDPVTLGSMFGGDASTSASACRGFSLPHAPASNANMLLSPVSRNPSAYSPGTILGKRSFEEAGLPIIPTSVPLSKRVTMPAVYGSSLDDSSAMSIMPVPCGASLHRISSYHPGTLDTTASSDGHSPTTPGGKVTRLPITRVKSATTSSAAAQTGVLASRGIAAAQNSSAQPPVQHQRKVAHNAIERRYRNNINDRIRDLRNAVPALQHIRPKIKTQSNVSSCNDMGSDVCNDVHSADEDRDTNEDAEDEGGTHIDGVEAATKLNKATILGKSTEYIYHLRRTNDLLKRESS
ncbi:hypothetical protein GGI12_000146, partial [Dipsacomyces acuminosporus]